LIVPHILTLKTIFRGAEDFEYSTLLDQAAKTNDVAEQLALITAFTMSTYSTVSDRVAKHFNPLLGETYENDRTSDMGWKLISEQVSHHPPILAQYAESKNGWKISQQLQLETKFRGKHITAIPVAFSRLDFEASGRTYIFNRPFFSVYNIIFGKMYVDLSGEVTVVGKKKAKGWKSTINYVPQGFLQKEQPRIVKGEITDPSENVRLVLNGVWNSHMTVAQVVPSGKNKFKTAEPSEIWRKRPPPSDSHLYYHFTTFACSLNEPEEGVAKTDSRRRTDLRLMENGQWDESNLEKIRLEEIQRERRKNYEDVKPLWFTQGNDEFSDKPVWKYNGNYWKCKETQDWSKCPDLW
jgi:hypothetical protein